MNNSGINMFEILAIVFIVLKLTNIITWSWIWVLSPLWIWGIIITTIIIILKKF